MVRSITRWITSRELEDDLRALACGLALCLYLWTLKVYLAGWYLFQNTPAFDEIRGYQMPLLGGGDLLLCAWVALLYFLLNQIGRCLPRPAKIAVAGVLPFLIHCGLVLFSTVSWQVSQIYGAPLDIGLVRAADDLRMMSSSIVGYLGLANVTLLIVGVASYPLLGRLFSCLLRRFPFTWLLVRWRLWAASLTIATLVGGLWVFEMRGVHAYALKYNAVIHFVQCYTPAQKPNDWAKLLPALNAGVKNHEDDLREPASLCSASRTLASDVHLDRKAEDYNVLMIILESTSRLYVDPHTTPNIQRLVASGLSLNNHFTTIALTHRAIYSILYSDYLFDVDSEIHQIYPGPVPLPSLAEVVRSHGYATAFFHSGYLSYGRLDYLLKGYDARIGAAEMPNIGRRWGWGVFEEQTVAELSQWITAHKNQRFFATYSTMFPHHPYVCPLPEKPFPTDTWATRYRNSLYYADQNIGQLIAHLQQEGLRDKTLIVVLADHGERTAGSLVGHGISMSMEEMCVPFIISNPTLFPTGQVSHLNSNHLDVAPTIAGLLGITPPSQWLGRNLLLPQIDPRLLFVRMAQARLTGVVDNGLLGVFDEKTGQSTLYQMPPDQIVPLPHDDSRNALLSSYQSKLDLFRKWAVWRHLHRAAEQQTSKHLTPLTDSKAGRQ